MQMEMEITITIKNQINGGNFMGRISSVVERGNHNPKVGGSNPSSATNNLLTPIIA